MTLNNTQPQHSEFSFTGFELSQYTPIPDQFFDELLPILTGSESKVLTYIFRHTFGFQKTAENISLNQMLYGVITNDGRQLDYGVGLAHSILTQALRQLADKGIIIVENNQNSNDDVDTTTYALNIRQKQEQQSALDILNESIEPRTGKVEEEAEESQKPANQKVGRTKVNLSLGVDTLILINQIRAKELEETGKQSPQSRIIDEAVRELAKSRGII